MTESSQREVATRPRAWASTIRLLIFAFAAIASFAALVFARLFNTGSPIVFMVLGIFALWVFAAFVAGRTVRISKFTTISENFRVINPYIFVAICVACSALATSHEIIIGYSVSEGSAWRLVPTFLIVSMMAGSPFIVENVNRSNIFNIIPSILFISSFMHVGSSDNSAIFGYMNSTNINEIVDANQFIRSIYNNFIFIFLATFISVCFVIKFFRNSEVAGSDGSEVRGDEFSIAENTWQGLGHYADSVYEFIYRVLISIWESLVLLFNCVFNRITIIYIVITCFSIFTVYVAIVATHMLFEQSADHMPDLESGHANVAVGIFAMSAWVGALVTGWIFGTFDDWRRTFAGLIPAVLMSLLALWVVSGLLEIAGRWLMGASGLAAFLPSLRFISELLIFGGIVLFVALREEWFGAGTRKFAAVAVILSLIGAALILSPFLRPQSQWPIAYTQMVRERIRHAVASAPTAEPTESAASRVRDLAWLGRKWGLASKCDELVTISLEGERTLNWELGGTPQIETIKSVEDGRKVITDHSRFELESTGSLDWMLEPGTVDELKQVLVPC